jgi:uncharacterized protein (DUF2267 family)
MHPNTFLRIVQQEAGLKNMDEAKLATSIVFDLLHHRISQDEAAHVKAQLPQTLAEIWEGGTIWFSRLLSRFEPQNKFNRKEFIDQVNARKGDLMTPGEKITRAVFYALQSQITPGESEDVAVQLPKDLRVFWNEARPVSPQPGFGGGQSERNFPDLA